MLEYFVDLGIELNLEKDASDLLNISFTFNRLNVVEYLNDMGVDVNMVFSGGQDGLIMASIFGYLDLARYLVTKGADKNRVDENGFNSLTWASTSADSTIGLQMVDYLEGLGAKLHLNAMYENKTPLMIAANKGRLEAVKYLVEKGADINTKGYEGRTALWYAVYEFRMPVIKYLIDQGAHDQISDRETTLMLAYKRIELPTGRLAKKPRYIRRRQKGYQLMEYLIGRGADANARSGSGHTILHEASEKGDLDVVRLLVFNGSDVNALGYMSFTPLHEAAKGGHLQVVKFLVERGANVNAQHGFIPHTVGLIRSSTPLASARAGKYEMVARYLESVGGRY